MELSVDILEVVKRMAAAAFNPAEIAYAIGVKEEDFVIALQDEESSVNNYFFKGFNSSELAIRESMFKLARDGSSPAQTTAMKLFDESKKQLRKYGYGSKEI